MEETIIKFDHMAMPVSNSKASRDWYVNNFGFEVEFEVNDDRKTVAIKDDADFTIFLYQQAEKLTGAKCSLTFQVKDVDAKYREMKDRGVAFENPPGKYFWGYGAELRDPDGYLVMIWDEVSMREKGGS
ncbi:MAG TPA: VOC family protein [Candidatus Binataceae bacterium]|nr:VOC family protein [Candidatus Binataceae bacterium]